MFPVVQGRRNPIAGNIQFSCHPAVHGTGTFNPATGQVTITSMIPPTVNPSVYSGGNLYLSGSGGTPGGTYTWLTATNVLIPTASWTVSTNGVYNAAGAFSNAIPINVSESARFFRFRTP